MLSLCLSVLSAHYRKDLRSGAPGPAIVPASELLAGVHWAHSGGLALVFALENEPDPAVGTVTHQWPLSPQANAAQLRLLVHLETGPQVSLTYTACGMALVNAPNAPYADVIMPLHVQGQEKPALLLLQCKWTSATKRLTSFMSTRSAAMLGSVHRAEICL